MDNNRVRQVQAGLSFRAKMCSCRKDDFDVPNQVCIPNFHLLLLSKKTRQTKVCRFTKLQDRITNCIGIVPLPRKTEERLKEGTDGTILCELATSYSICVCRALQCESAANKDVVM